MSFIKQALKTFALAALPTGAYADGLTLEKNPSWIEPEVTQPVTSSTRLPNGLPGIERPNPDKLFERCDATFQDDGTVMAIPQKQSGSAYCGCPEEETGATLTIDGKIYVIEGYSRNQCTENNGEVRQSTPVTEPTKPDPKPDTKPDPDPKPDPDTGPECKQAALISAPRPSFFA